MLDDEFECPNCQALYKMVRVSSGPEIIDRLLHCKVCNQPLAPTHDGKILKYFLAAEKALAVSCLATTLNQEIFELLPLLQRFNHPLRPLASSGPSLA
jgi:hypothetical protein